MNIDSELINSVAFASLTTNFTDQSKSTVYVYPMDSNAHNETGDENTTISAEPASKRKNESLDEIHEVSEPKRHRQETPSVELIDPNVAQFDTMEHDVGMIVQSVSPIDEWKVKNYELLSEHQFTTDREQNVDRIKFILQTMDNKSVEVCVSRNMILRINLDNRLSYQSRFTCELASAVLQALLNQLQTMTMAEFRFHMSQAFSSENRKLAKPGSTRQKPIFTNDAKLENVEVLMKAKFNLCEQLEAEFNSIVHTKVKDDCIHFIWEPKEVSKRVVITKKIVIRISLPVFNLEYQIKLTDKISPTDLRNLLKFVDQSGEEEWRDFSKSASRDKIVHSVENNIVVDLCKSSEERAENQPGNLPSNEPEPFYVRCRREMTVANPQWKNNVKEHRPNDQSKMPELTQSMLKETLDKMWSEMEKYVSTDDELVRSLRFPSINYDVMNELRWWTKGSSAFLGDKIINAYLKLICERSSKGNGLPKVYAMDTYFLPELHRDGKYNYDHVRESTSDTDIFTCDIILVPVHISGGTDGGHWCMAIIDMRYRTIKYYNSIGAPNDAVLTSLLQYLKDEYRDKKREEFDMSGWQKENVLGLNIPQQDNGYDCGVFSCMYAEFITRNQSLNRDSFSQNDMIYFRKKMTYELCMTQELLAY
ncbi:sentrin-specific protease 1-like isoform X2 [Sitodiplosis mosellana]|uniref:sentrin-specific protease 1-like isoform X2 n=1 Tax=Sitodiplosis mosellana TaxID=263140 RepID=UPI0024446B95|nr:sentrin-specific protease 1-like isoform X2 [Sitodiplosis mosellana]